MRLEPARVALDAGRRPARPREVRRDRAPRGDDESPAILFFSDSNSIDRALLQTTLQTILSRVSESRAAFSTSRRLYHRLPGSWTRKHTKAPESTVRRVKTKIRTAKLRGGGELTEPNTRRPQEEVVRWSSVFTRLRKAPNFSSLALSSSMRSWWALTIRLSCCSTPTCCPFRRVSLISGKLTN